MLEVKEHYMKSRLDTFTIFSAVKHFFSKEIVHSSAISRKQKQVRFSK